MGLSREADPSVTLIALRFGHSLGRLPPLGPLCLAGALTESRVAWQIVDTTIRSGFDAFSLEELVALIDDLEGDVLGFSVFHDAIPLVVAALNQMQERLRRKRVFLGGPGVVGIERLLLAEVPALEAVVTGEAELVLPQLVKGRPGTLTLPGVWQRHNPSRHLLASSGPAQSARPEKLDTLAEPAWSWCEGRSYRVVPLSMMRGCPFACTFCEVEAHMGRRVRRVTPARAIQRLADARRYVHGGHVQILDDAFAMNRTYIGEFCRLLARMPWRTTFELFARPNLLDEDTVCALAAAGCNKVSMGIDAGDDALLRRVTHGMTIADALEAVRRISRHIPVEVNLMWGYPFESIASFTSTLSLCHRLPGESRGFPVTAELYLLQPAIATKLFAEYGPTTCLREDALPTHAEAGARTVASYVLKDRGLGAAFYRYATPCYAEKRRLLAEYQETGRLRRGNPAAAVPTVHRDLRKGAGQPCDR